MLSISPDALAIIGKKGRAIHLDLPPVSRGGCCVAIQECPEVRYGPPRDQRRYEEHLLQGIKVYVPKEMHLERKYTITVASLFGLKWVVLEGWSPL
jgi:hypothetical protein